MLTPRSDYDRRSACRPGNERVLKYLQSVRLRQRAQNVVEYGIIVAVIAVASIGGFNALSTVIKGYFQSQGTTLAPQPPSFGPLVPNTKLVVTGPLSGTYGGTINVTATLTSGSTAVSGKTISFSING